MPRRACSKDANQDEIAQTFQRLGWQVIDTHEVAQYIPGFPDLLAARWPITLYVEVKMPGEMCTEAEKVFLGNLCVPWLVCRTIDDVIDAHQELTGLRIE